jgi:hypothetical protein
MEDMDCPLEPHHELAAITSKRAEGLCFFLKNVHDGVRAFAMCEGVDEPMLKQLGACSPIEFAQGSIEERLQFWGGVGTRHIDRAVKVGGAPRRLRVLPLLSYGFPSGSHG